MIDLSDWPAPIAGDSATILGDRWGLLCAEAEAIENFARWTGNRRNLFDRTRWLIRWDSGCVNGCFCRWSAGLKARVWYDEERGGGYQVEQ